MERKEKVDELYQEYLSEKLDLVFDGVDGTKFENSFYIARKEEGAAQEKRIYPKKIEKDGKYNYINEDGRIISSEWFDFVYDFQNGCVAVRKNGKFNYIDINGKKLFKEWFSELWWLFYGDCIARVRLGDKFNCINKSGKLMSSEWFDEIDGEYIDGYIIVKKGNKYNFINNDGKIISPEWFDSVLYFHEGYAMVKDSGKYNYIDGEGKLVYKEWFEYEFDTIWRFRNGYAVVVKNGKYNYIKNLGKIISSEWFDDAFGFLDGFAEVKKNNKYNFINSEGKIISKDWFDEVGVFHNGYIEVKKDNKYNYMDSEGKMLFSEWLDGKNKSLISDYIYAKKDGKYCVFDRNGNLLYKNVDDFKAVENFIIIKCSKKEQIICRDINLGDFKVKKGLFGYYCESLTDKFKMKYQPIRKIGIQYYLCLDGENVYLYDRFGNNYSLLGTIYDIKYDDNFIVDRKSKLIYLMYGGKIIDITDYYKKNLEDKKNITISKGIKGILTRDEFSLLNMSEIDRIMDEERKKNTEIRLAQEKQMQMAMLKKKKENDKQKEIESQKKRIDALKQLQEILKVLSETSKNGKTSRILFPDIFVELAGHKEINPEMLGLLKYIELSYIKFDNVKVDGIDFSGCNIDMGHGFNPQKVYGKSLRNCNLEGVYLPPMLLDFSGVDIRGCRFGSDDDYMTRDFIPESFKDAIYDETTTYNGEPLTKIFNDVKKR